MHMTKRVLLAHFAVSFPSESLAWSVDGARLVAVDKGGSRVFLLDFAG